MSQQLAESLKNHPYKSEYVFTNPNGMLIDKDVWRRRIFRKALEKAKLRRIRIHDLRHTYASLRISKGDNIQDVSKQLGHHSVKLTLDVYSHWMPGKKKSEVDALDDHTPTNSPAPYTHPELPESKKWTTEKPVIH
jgi:integrase